MPKLKLALDALAVDTFTTGAAHAERGTIQGAQLTLATCSPAENTKCTSPCFSGLSRCDMISCGSTCVFGGC